MTALKPPAGSGASGRRLWRSVVDVYDLAEHELALLREAVRTVDMLDVLAAVVAAEGPVVETPSGLKAHPALVEARQLRIVLSRLVASLRMPEDEDETARPQRRGAARGAYAPRRLYGSLSVVGHQ